MTAEEELYDIAKKIKLTKIDEKNFAISYKEKIFYIGQYLYEIIELLIQMKSISEIETIINKKFHIELTEQKIRETLGILQQKLTLTSGVNSTLYVYIYGKLTILKQETLISITKYFKFLFYKPLSIFLFLVAICSSVYFCGHIFTTGLFTEKLSIGKSFFYFSVNYLFIVLVGIFHEIGHSSASSKYGIHSKEIGFGFYIVFPVFYTDISKIWLLNRRKRIIINLAGIYFQLLVNILLVFIFFLVEFNYEEKILLKTLFLTNCTLCIYALNPFMRNDGYWVYSDFFNIPNLTEAAKKYPKQFVSDYLLSKNHLNTTKLNKLKKEIPLLIYSIFLHIIIVLIYVGLVILTYKNIHSVIELFNNNRVNHAFLFEDVYNFLAIIFSITINFIFVYRVITGFFIKRNNNFSIV